MFILDALNLILQIRAGAAMTASQSSRRNEPSGPSPDLAPAAEATRRRRPDRPGLEVAISVADVNLCDATRYHTGRSISFK
eukprot:8163445-Pyramimonas_sp.AAC.1